MLQCTNRATDLQHFKCSPLYLILYCDLSFFLSFAFLHVTTVQAITSISDTYTCKTFYLKNLCLIRLDMLNCPGDNNNITIIVVLPTSTIWPHYCSPSVFHYFLFCQKICFVYA